MEEQIIKRSITTRNTYFIPNGNGSFGYFDGMPDIYFYLHEGAFYDGGPIYNGNVIKNYNYTIYGLLGDTEYTQPYQDWLGYDDWFVPYLSISNEWIDFIESLELPMHRIIQDPEDPYYNTPLLKQTAIHWAMYFSGSQPKINGSFFVLNYHWAVISPTSVWYYYPYYSYDIESDETGFIYTSALSFWLRIPVNFNFFIWWDVNDRLDTGFSQEPSIRLETDELYPGDEFLNLEPETRYGPLAAMDYYEPFEKDIPIKDRSVFHQILWTEEFLEKDFYATIETIPDGNGWFTTRLNKVYKTPPDECDEIIDETIDDKINLVKSNSVLASFTKAGKYENSDKLNFLHFIQSLSLDVSANRINSKFIGKSKYLKDQFVEPDVNLNLTFLNTKDFFNESIFGFNLSEDKIFKSLVQDGVFNKNSLILLNNVEYPDLLDTGLKTSQKYISLANLYLENYSISYKINSLPVVSASLVGSNFKIGDVSQTTNLNNQIVNFTIMDWNNVSRTIADTTFSEFKLDTERESDRLVFVMNGISAVSTLKSTLAPGISFSSFLDGAINSFDISIDFNRKKFYYFNGTNSPSDRRIILPISGNVKISGTSANLAVGNLKCFFSKNQKFKIDISIFDGITSSSKLILDNIFIESYSYSINLDGFLEYEISCFFQPYDDFKIEVNNFSLPSSDSALLSQNSQIIQSSDGFSF